LVHSVILARVCQKPWESGRENQPQIVNFAARNARGEKAIVCKESRKNRSRLTDSYVNKAAVGISEPAKSRVTQVNLSSLPDQTRSRAAIGDLNDNAPPGVRHDDPCAQIVKPRRSSELVWIERFAVGHQQAAMVFSVPGSLVGGVTGHAP
jgi:hypothetical protein